MLFRQCKAEVYYLCSRAVLAKCIVVDMGSQEMPVYTRKHGPSTRVVFTCAQYTLPVFTGRADGPCSRPWTRPAITGIQNDTRVRHPCSRV